MQTNEGIVMQISRPVNLSIRL